MPIVSTLGLAGGQGKTTVALMLGRYLGRLGIPVLFVDADPQSSLTSFLGIKLQANTPTLLEVITLPESQLRVVDGIAPVPSTTGDKQVTDNSNLFLIPADDGLEAANYKLAASGMSLFTLRQRLEPLIGEFGAIIVDPPPERSHLAQTSLGAADRWLIPAEASTKGVQSLVRTLALIQEFQSALPGRELLGVVPFRAKWVGRAPTRITSNSIEAMTELVGADLMLPHILESDVYKQAIDLRVSPTDLGSPQLEYAIEQLVLKLKPSLAAKYQDLIKL
jgi:chromosome partitioning protein